MYPANMPVNIVVEHQNTQNSLLRILFFILFSFLSISYLELFVEQKKVVLDEGRYWLLGRS